MGIELKDYRGRITPETDCVLEAIARATGQDRQVIVRDILHRWATEQIHAATVMDRLLQAEGLSGIAGGTRGDVREPEGTGRRGGAEG